VRVIGTRCGKMRALTWFHWRVMLALRADPDKFSID
jgi:hypothetical protein